VPLWLALLPLCGLLFFHRLGDRELASSHEARAAQNAQTMLDTGDWGLPRLFDRRAELQKPPLYYWLVAAAGWLAGGRVDGWAVRLPAALAALATVLAVFALCARRGRPVGGLVAAAALATSLHFTWLARVGRIDMPLTLTVTLALAGFHLGQLWRGGWRWSLLAYVALGVGLLLKGPIAVVLPALVIGLHALFDRGAQRHLGGIWRSAHERGLWWGLPLVALIAAPWYLWANAHTDGELFRVFFWHHNLQRGLGGGEGLAAHPWWFYGPRLAVDLLPWSLALPLAGWYLWRHGRADPEARLGAAWLLAVVVFLSCMSFKRADYLLPAYPGAALVLGCAAERWYRRARRPRRLAVAFGLAAGICAAGWVGYVEALAPHLERERPDRRFAEEIRRLTRERVIFFRTEAHALALHVGRPMHTVLEWENLNVWAGKAEAVYVVMPADCAAEWHRHLTAGGLVEVLRTDHLTPCAHERPLVLMRTAGRRGKAGAQN
jgi:4-amino-4-deoxy-L-arabinose transferase-like glycosyltransferase